MMIRDYFRSDNTEGYTTAQLVEVNRRLEADYAEIGDDDDGTILKWLGEQVLTAYDTELAHAEDERRQEAFRRDPYAWTDENGMRYRCGRCHAPMLALLPAELSSGACICGGLIEAHPANFVPPAVTAHAQAETLWEFNFSDRATEEFEGLLGVVERTLRSERLRAKLPPEYEFLHYHFAALRDRWTPLSALYGDENTGTRCNQYETLVWLGIAERKTEPVFDASGRPRGSRTLFRLAQAPGNEERTRIEVRP